MSLGERQRKHISCRIAGYKDAMVRNLANAAVTCVPK